MNEDERTTIRSKLTYTENGKELYGFSVNDMNKNNELLQKLIKQVKMLWILGFSWLAFIIIMAWYVAKNDILTHTAMLIGGCG